LVCAHHDLEQIIEGSLRFGYFIGYRDTFSFVEDLEEVSARIGGLIDSGEPERAVGLYELFIGGCYAKVEEIDDSGGSFGTFVEGLFCRWILARQAANADASETAEILISWMDKDPYGFCYTIEQEAVKVFDRPGLAAFEKLIYDRFESTAESIDLGESVTNQELAYLNRRSVEVLKTIYEKRQDPDSYIRICDRTGLTPKDCEVIAGIYRKHRKYAEALDWVERGIEMEDEGYSGRDSSYQLDRMKRKLFAKLGRREEALESAWSSYQQHPSTFTYEELMEYVPGAQRAEWRLRAVDAAGQGSLESVIDLYLELDELDRLADQVRKANDERLERISHYLTEPAAEKLAGPFPEMAARLYRALGVRILAAGKSKYYHAALRHFEEAKRCYQEAGREDLWDALVADVCRDHKRKYTFMPGFEKVVAGEEVFTERPFSDRVHQMWEKRGRNRG